jgi:hypothetical protein
MRSFLTLLLAVGSLGSLGCHHYHYTCDSCDPCNGICNVSGYHYIPPASHSSYAIHQARFPMGVSNVVVPAIPQVQVPEAAPQPMPQPQAQPDVEKLTPRPMPKND